MTYFERLSRRCEETAGICVGIDPHGGVLDTWSMSHDVHGVERIAMGVIEALGDQVAAFKPQSAFFEMWGSPGIAVLERCISAIRETGALVILDVKRGDIGSTMQAYAQAYLGDGPLGVDAITVSPYLGFGALQPAFEMALNHGRGVYVLARTSNPEGADIQLGSTHGGAQVAQGIVDQGQAWNDMAGANVVSLVVGGTHADLGIDLTEFTSSLLIPGIGTQGGTISGLESSMGGTQAVLLPSVSREVLMAGPDPQGLRDAVSRVLTS
jgi:orotidine-5'-phosphate decarboxylase